MATLTFSTNLQAEARILVEALNAWLEEQEPVQPLRPGTAHFEYDHDGFCTVTVALDDEV
ncbi:hypothetical protein NVV94_10800 [Pseudomonas sp. LS1212]|uniref:hypothetical protein n=1 Tax=Pseudomonas sp. LS1212 TaxID=2972478 RepID=UPI00215B8501|nr:hypothetical protein [Pseudomonas sp. LS1212]UVJ45983.1 hypothetical protein NVV94_10800 [Pseudomonas sp. LS1212]